ncbi:EAL domain-containing protein [Ureibacillus chungkukjangi]|uniref:sensor domain-containing phosphodiesterase n=1 Tax=Ureibacillus chungkukjangi TaxID=1202712 RepID=UPI00203C2BEB|nr:EAL domain-containing protein [Ureibacillus chungkukjangi]MCM3387931.1 EAL domain-containing protein [Ureibacillus chungkukjangi]
MYNTKMPLTKDELFPFLCNISEQFHIGIGIISLEKSDFPFVYINQAFTALTGYLQDELIGKNFNSLTGIKTSMDHIGELFCSIKKKSPFEKNILHYQKDGSAFWNHVTCQPIKDRDGIASYALVHCKDITEQMLSKMLSKLEHEVYIDLEENGDFKNILQLITEKVEKYYIRDIFCGIHVVNQEQNLEAIASGSLPLSLIKSLNHLEIGGSTTGYNESVVYINDLTIKNNKSSKLIKKYNLNSCWSKPIFTNEKVLLGYFSIYIKGEMQLRQADIDFLKKLSPIVALSMKYVKQKQELKKLAFFDMSTGMPNYNSFYTSLVTWMDEKVNGSLLLIQPNEYSSIVDLYGRKFGDELIGQMVDRFLSIKDLKEEFVYGRFSTSSFMIGVKQSHKDHLTQFIKQILQITAVPFTIAEREIFITLKIGVSHFNEFLTIDESIRRADTALTKSRLQNTPFSYFEMGTDEMIQRELNILNQLQFGIKNKELTVYLQPKINLLTNEIEGFEALARWNSPVLGNVSPAEFIPIAEKSGKINEIDNLILRKVLIFQNHRQTNGLKMIPIAVNISPVHFYSESFINDFLSLVAEYHISPHYIKIEVTESVELFDFVKAKEILLELKKLGYESSIDDFGVGFSSLSYLQQLPFSEIKIDRSFINDIENSDMHAVVQTIVQLADKLRMHVVAEGIETSEQYSILQKIGCKSGQGFYFHKPMPLEEAQNLLDSISEK